MLIPCQNNCLFKQFFQTKKVWISFSFNAGFHFCNVPVSYRRVIPNVSKSIWNFDKSPSAKGIQEKIADINHYKMIVLLLWVFYKNTRHCSTHNLLHFSPILLLQDFDVCIAFSVHRIFLFLFLQDDYPIATTVFYRHLHQFFVLTATITTASTFFSILFYCFNYLSGSKLLEIADNIRKIIF